MVVGRIIVKMEIYDGIFLEMFILSISFCGIDGVDGSSASFRKVKDTSTYVVLGPPPLLDAVRPPRPRLEPRSKLGSGKGRLLWSKAHLVEKRRNIL